MTIKKAKNDFRLWSWVRPEPSEAQRPVRYVAALWIFFSHVTSSGIPPPPPPPCCVPRYAPPELMLRYLGAESTHRSTTEHWVSRKKLNHEVGRIRNFSSVFFNARRCLGFFSFRHFFFFFLRPADKILMRNRFIASSRATDFILQQGACLTE